MAFATYATQHLTGSGRYQPYPWLRMLNNRLVDVAERRTRFLIVVAPVRHGKSEMGSKWFPAWYLGSFPNDRVIFGGHNQDFARIYGRATRDILIEHGEDVFGVRVAIPRGNPLGAMATISYKAADWGLSPPWSGGMRSVGVANPPTGRGGNLIVIDDPIKSDMEAYSAAYRAKMWRWWQMSMRSRVEPGGCVVLIMSRWHDDDLIGRLLARQDKGAYDGEPDEIDHLGWEVLHLPALADPDLIDPDPLRRAPGEALCPQRYDRSALLSLRDNPSVGVGPVAFEALYQGRPTRPEGGMFKRSKWRYLRRTELPEKLPWVRWWDLAASDDPNADWTVGVLMANTVDGYTVIGDVARVQADPEGTERFLRETARADIMKWDCRRQMVPQDPGQAGKAQVSYMQRVVFKDLAIVVGSETMTGSKEVRAMPLSMRQGAGMVHLVVADWNELFVKELAGFLAGEKWDDQVDAAAMAYQDVAGLLKAKVKLLV
jgi:predicted phage terminase large subunit-like protein